MMKTPELTAVTSMAFDSVLDFQIKVTKKHLIFGAKAVTLTFGDQEYQLAALDSYPTELYIFSRGKYKGLPVLAAPIHYIAWYLAVLSFKPLTECSKEELDHLRPAYDHLYQSLLPWGASLLTDKRMAEVRAALARGQAPYKARELIAKMWGIEAIYYRLAHTTNAKSVEDQRMMESVSYRIEDSGGVKWALDNLLERRDQLSFVLDDVSQIEF